MEKKCSKCKAVFYCSNEAGGCWCETLVLSKEALAYLKTKYENCLCPRCLKECAAMIRGNDAQSV